jgi:hypothetical protein
MAVNIHDTFGEYSTHDIVPGCAIDLFSGAGFIGGMVAAMCVERVRILLPGLDNVIG